jgi:hypothetical protein
MRTLIATFALGTALMLGGATAWKAEAATAFKGAAPAASADTITQLQKVRCYRNAPVDGCGRGFYRTKRGGCRPC